MRIPLVLVVLGLVGCLASEPLVYSDEMLTDEQLQLKRDTAPSFDEIKRKLEESGTLNNPAVIGLFPYGEVPSNEGSNMTTSSPLTTPFPRLPTFPPVKGPLCPERHAFPILIHYGLKATLLIKNFGCYGTCAHCGKYRGTCRKTSTWMIYHFVIFGWHNRQFGWHWIWKGVYIPACCQCFSVRP